MGQGITVGMRVGFFMSYGEALRPFSYEMDGSHGEEAGTYVKLPNVKGTWGPVQLGSNDEEMGSPGYDGTEDFLEELGSLLNCRIEAFGGEFSFVGFSVSENEDYLSDSYDPSSRSSVGRSLSFEKVLSMKDRVQTLRQKMEEFGYKDVGEAKIFSIYKTY